MLFTIAVVAWAIVVILWYREYQRVKREEDLQKAKDLVDVATRRHAFISNKTTNWSE